MRILQRLGLVVCIWTFVLMMIGGYVKAIGAGLACPDWPTCYGKWFPPWPTDVYTNHQIAAEWVHRAVAGLLGPILIAFAVLAWREREAHPVVRYTPLAALGVLGLQVVLGGLTVIKLLKPIIVVSHLGTATIFLLMMTVTTVMLYVHPYADPRTGMDSGRHGRRPDGVWRDPTTGVAGRTTRPEKQDEPAPSPNSPNEARTLHGIVSDYVSMTKPRVMGLLVLTSVTAMFIAAGGIPALWPTVGVIVGGMLATGGAGAFNHFLERDLDRNMARTKDRPVATGRIKAGHALTFGVVLSLLAFTITQHLANLLAAFFAMAGLLFYVVVYTMWLKRTTSLNIVIGGAAGGFPALVGWAAVTGTVDAAAWLFFLLIVMWTPPHFWALALVLKDDYGRAGVPMLPSVKGIPRTTKEILVYSVVTVLLSFGFYTLDVLGTVYLMAAAALGGLFLVLAIQLHTDPTKRAARALFGYSIVYLGLLYVAAFVDVALRYTGF